ncbi:hypothetical protein ACLOJK_015921 [Asimina triloba]
MLVVLLPHARHPPSAVVNGVALCCSLAGQLFFGWLGDKLGRKRVYGLTLLLMVVCSVAYGLSFRGSPKAVMAILCFCRFCLGFGIGGDYPLSATIMSEYANKKTRGAFIAAVFAMQGSALSPSSPPPPSRPATPLLLTRSMPPPPLSPRPTTSGGSSSCSAFPDALTYYWGTRMPETARYTAVVANSAKRVAADISKVLLVEIGARERHLQRRRMDSADEDDERPGGVVPHRWRPLLALCSTVPGYWFTVYLIDRVPI